MDLTGRQGAVQPDGVGLLLQLSALGHLKQSCLLASPKRDRQLQTPSALQSSSLPE